MNFTFTWFSLLLFIGLMAALVLIAVIWTRRSSPGMVPLTLFMSAAAFWMTVGAFELAAADLSVKILFSQIGYFGFVSGGVFWLIFVLDYTGSKWWKNPFHLFLISIIPLIVLVLVWTNGLHSLIWSNVYLTDGPTGVMCIYEKGPLYMLNPYTQYMLYFSGIVILFRFSLRRRLYRKQVRLILIGTLIPIIGSILYTARVNIGGGQDITSFYMIISGIFYCVAILRYRFPDLSPLAKTAIDDTSPDGFLILDNQGFVVGENPAAARFAGREPKEMQGNTIAALWPELQNLLLETSDMVPTDITVTSNGQTRNLDIKSVPLFDTRRNEVGTLVVMRDITELKTAQQELQSLYDKERELSESLEKEISRRSQYTRALVHELGTPLTAIVAAIDLLEGLVDDPTQKKIVRNIIRSSQNLEQRIHELLELARGELGVLDIEPELTDLNRVIRDVADEMKPVAAEKGVSLRTELTDEDLTTMLDTARIRQVMMNLLSNAVKFTRQGEIIIRSSIERPEWIRVTVQDSGIGIDLKQIKYLFDPYFSKSKENSGTVGLGIGLYLSKVFVELHGGTIQAESDYGKGSTFSFTLPVKNR